MAERRAARSSSGGTLGGLCLRIRGTVGAGPGSSTSDGADVLWPLDDKATYSLNCKGGQGKNNKAIRQKLHKHKGKALMHKYFYIDALFSWKSRNYIDKSHADSSAKTHLYYHYKPKTFSGLMTWSSQGLTAFPFHNFLHDGIQFQSYFLLYGLSLLRFPFNVFRFKAH